MTLEEAMHIANNRLPDEPAADPLANWRATKPPAEPARKTRGLDTVPAPVIDWALVIRQALLGERAHMTEAIGGAIGEVRNDTLDEVEQLIAAAADQIKSELRTEIEQMRFEFFKRLDLVRGQGVELRAELEAAIAKKKRARPMAQPNGSGSLLQLPAPLADASLAPDALSPGPNGNGSAQ
jgi:hypothetical protein